MAADDNLRKHTTKNPVQRFLIDRFHDVLIEELGRAAPDFILDVGCGEGFTLEKVRKSGIGERLEGIDIRPRAIERGREMHPELALTQGDVYELPYQDGSFDAVLCCEVLEHLERPDDALKELRRVTKRYCIITVPHEPWFSIANLLRGKNFSRLGNDDEHIQRWSARDITALVGNCFTVRTVRHPFPWTMVVGEKR